MLECDFGQVWNVTLVFLMLNQNSSLQTVSLPKHYQSKFFSRFCFHTRCMFRHTFACMRYTVIHKTKMNLSTVKWAQWDKTQSRELLDIFLCVCIARCTIVAHNILQNRPDNFPSYSADSHHCCDDIFLREGGQSRCRLGWGLRWAQRIVC